MQNFIQDIKTKLNIKGGIFIDAEIEDYINEIDPSRHLEFFKALSGGEYEYKNAMDRIAMTAKRFKNEKTDNLLAGTREKAKAMYDKFYDESCMMFKHTYDNRDKYPSDAEFFDNVQYKNLKKIDGTSVYTEQEIYVLDELGGGKWLIGIRLALSSKDIIDKIEQVIKDAVMKKYLGSNNLLVNSEVKKKLAIMHM